MNRPLCECHSKPKYKDGVRSGIQQWRCSVKQAAWGADRYKSNSAEENYQRYRRLLIARIEYKRERITQLEVELNA